MRSKSILRQSLELLICPTLPGREACPRRPPSHGLLWIATAITALSIQGCGGSDAAAPANSLSIQSFFQHNDASESGLQISASDPGVSPFITHLAIHGKNLALLTKVAYTVQPKAGSVSKAVNVSYSASALAARGYLQSGDSVMTLPVIGLYAGYTNSVTLQFQFQDGSRVAIATNITTADSTALAGIYLHPTILKQRAAGSSLGFNFFYIKSALGSPVIVDSDGEVRWAVPGVESATSSALQADEFVIGGVTATIQRARLDGNISQDSLASTSLVSFHHNIDPGKTALLAEVNTQTNGIENIESTVEEITSQGSILNQWNLGAVISAYMLSQGDDPTAFVRPGADWFHNNATAYDSSDNSILISSRENFVIKLDYQTGRIIWILGDPTKYWYTFASLRSKALTLAPGGLYPIGQHAISITPGGHLLLFNDGLGSLNQPAGAPAGETRTYSAVSAYSVDTNTMTAQNIWNFENGQTIFSSICSSAYKAPEDSLLIDYATADDTTHAILVGLDSTHNVVFEFQYPTEGCGTSWNAVPIPLENLTID
jgi:arylsulfate sulfotransferase